MEKSRFHDFVDLKEMIETTSVCLKNQTMTGRERFPVIGDAVTSDKVVEIVSKFVGLSLMNDCFFKATIASRMLDDSWGKVGGIIRVFDPCTRAGFGFDWHPPFEGHVWLCKKENDVIFDPALSGVILRGLVTQDHVGFLLTTVRPFIIAGNVWRENNLWYKPVQILN